MMNYVRFLRGPCSLGAKVAGLPPSLPKLAKSPIQPHVFSMSTVPLSFGRGSTLLRSTRTSSPLVSLHCKRNYMRKKTIKMPPTKPLNFDYSGDIVKVLPHLNPSLLRPGFEDSKEIESADENVKKLFSIEFADGHEILQKRLEDIITKVQEHPADVRSLEVKIATFTVLIRNQMKHAYAFRKDKVSKSMLIRRIQARRKYLTQLRLKDSEKFEFLLKELNLQHIPVPQYNRKISKREARKKAAMEAGKQIMKAKMEEFRKRLEQEKKVFAKEKEEELAAIRTELHGMGITETDSIASIFRGLNLGGKYDLDKKVKKKSRRDQLLEKKFELYANRAKIETPT